MKKFIPLALLLVGIALVVRSLLPERNKTEFDLVGFGRLPVVVNGRVKPLDTVARTALVILQSSQTIPAPDGTKLTPNEWLLDVLFRSQRADGYQHFEINHPDLLALFGLTIADGRDKKRFSFRQIEPKMDELQRQVGVVRDIESAHRTPFQKAVIQLYSNLGLYIRLKASLVAPDHRDFLQELMAFQSNVTAGVTAIRAQQAKQPFDDKLAAQMMESAARFDRLRELAYLLAVPPAGGDADVSGWKNLGDSLLNSFQTQRVDPSLLVYAGLARTWRADQPKEFNELLSRYRTLLEKGLPVALKKSAAEARFNAVQPFYTATILYVFAFFVAVSSWLVWPVELGRVAHWLIGFAWLLATGGILARMWLGGYAPVTNLYSSALFVAWVAAAFCIVMEKIFRNGIATVAAALIGIPSLIIAHHLAMDGDTLEMMRAVLDSNFWLSTHVITVTAGYGATFLAGALGLIYIARGVFTPSLDKPTADALSRMIYGIVCFATLFSLVGTILGGIWADQSWGRFWGWDPKENGALMIVIWNALLLHARWGGLAKARGIAALAVFGNVVTAWSWFGVNLLGVGLHSYGFTENGALWLIAFAASQVAMIVIAYAVPFAKWRSFRDRTA